jgi:hypothetical protein
MVYIQKTVSEQLTKTISTSMLSYQSTEAISRYTVPREYFFYHSLLDVISCNRVKYYMPI